MTPEQLRNQIAVKLDEQALDDLRSLMATPAGRRFFCWLVMKCGQNSTSFTRDSRTYFNEGMRNVALLLESRMRELGLSGVDTMHVAERDYIVFQEDIKHDIEEKEKQRG